MNTKEIEKLLSNLDSEQSKACSAPFAPTLVRAVAGSGKTRVLTHRVAYTIESGNNPNEMLLLTFTNKASREMLDRVKTLIGSKGDGVTGGTFHSVGARILRKTCHHLGYKPNFSILDPDDARGMIDRLLVDELKKYDMKKSEFPNKKVIYGLYSSSINLKKTIREIDDNLTEFQIGVIKDILKNYISTKKEQNVMDFDDLILNFMRVLKIESVQRYLSGKYKYVFCDEYQDINWIQGAILKLLNQYNQTIYVVGDPCQSIYSWRGSDVSFIEDFANQFENSNVYDITYNYRSLPRILELAEESINNNYYGKEESIRITPFLTGGIDPTYDCLSNGWEQLDFIVDKISKHRSSGIPYDEMAILIRVNYLTRDLEKKLKQSGIPYQLIAGYSFFERLQVKDMMAFMKIISNPADEASYLRALCMFPGIKKTTAGKIYKHIALNDYSISSLQTYKTTKTNAIGVNIFHSIMSTAMSFSTVSEKFKYIVDDFYETHLELNEEDAINRMEDVKYMLDSSYSYEDLSSFIEDMTLVVEDKSSDEDNGVIITTYHKSKGLEWDVVFMPYVGNGLMPMASSTAEIEEERRLFYVGITRAKKHLSITHIPEIYLTKKQLPESDFISELEFFKDGSELPDLDSDWLTF